MFSSCRFYAVQMTAKEYLLYFNLIKVTEPLHATCLGHMQIRLHHVVILTADFCC